MASHPEYRAYLKEYRKAYYRLHKEKINQNRKKYPDRTRNERVSKFRKKEALNLADNYIIRILTLKGKFKKEDITPEIIETRRKQISLKRQNKNSYHNWVLLNNSASQNFSQKAGNI